MSANHVDTENELEQLRAEYAKLEESNRDLNERVLELYTLYNISRSLSLSLQLNELFETIIRLITEALSVDEFTIMLLNEEQTELTVQACHGLQDERILNARVPLGTGMPGQVIQGGKSVLIEDISTIDNFVYYEGSDIDSGSYLGVPLTNKAGMPLGVINAHNPRPNGFAKHEVHLFEEVAAHVGIAIENAWTYQRTQELSNRDHLTGLFNRRYFFERFERELERAQRYDRILSLLIMDIDLFKEFNDKYGHLAGDDAIRRVADAIQDEVRKVDILARYGGEEFVVLLPETDKDAACTVAEKIRRTVEGLTLTNDQKLTLTIGVAAYPLEAQEPLDLLERADRALYLGKAEGRNRVCARVPVDAH